MKICLGIDTSCYTTSLALLDSEGNLLSEARKLLTVPHGGRGLAQSEAVFQHINNLPELFKKIFSEKATGIYAESVTVIAASTRPRPQQGSYMPVFRVAESYGKSLSAALNVPFISTSHQEGHIAAGLWSAKLPDCPEFLAVHVSGGTTELLRVKTIDSGPKYEGYETEILGGSNDLHAGQFIDRVGVALDLPFPAGPHLEKIAEKSRNNISVPSSVKGYSISFSGPETAAIRLIEKNTAPADIARAVEKCVALSLIKILKKAIEETGCNKVLVVGGVSANKYIREKLVKEIAGYAGTGLYFAETIYSSDNAVGVAAIGMRSLE